MKRKINYKINKKTVEREISYIPVRYIIAVMMTIFEIVGIILTVVLLCYFVPYFYVAAFVTEIVCLIRIAVSDDNPDYKIPWLIVVMFLPIIGFMLYFIFSKRVLKRKFVSRLEKIHNETLVKEDEATKQELEKEDKIASLQANQLCKISGTSLYSDTKQEYFESGERMYLKLLDDLKNAKKFILMEYFIIEEGQFWNSILNILKEKASNGVDVKVIYDDIGCMGTLHGSYYKTLRKMGIEATTFSRLKGNADSEFNNRNHRKITVIDGKIGYSGGINIADEYINMKSRFGYWKDTAIRIEGNAVNQLTKLFLMDFYMNINEAPENLGKYFVYENRKSSNEYLIPFGDGPKPIYQHRVAKIAIENMLASATQYVYITTPYLIIDNELCKCIENTALKGVDVRIITPHIPDKRLVFSITRSFYLRLINAGVKIYEYEPGFIHAKTYIADDKYAIIGTVNLDYRSLVHHFENGIWMYNCKSIENIKKDMEETINKSIKIEKSTIKINIFKRILRSLVKIFAPLL